MLGRVISAARAIGWATLPIGALVGGWLGNTESTYPWVARIFPLILLGCALWLFTTVIWSDTFGPEFRRTSPGPAEQGSSGIPMEGTSDEPVTRGPAPQDESPV
jgi:hypothetical protein